MGSAWDVCRLLVLCCVCCVLSTEVRSLCRSATASSSCGQCIKQHPSCAWCLDPHSKSQFRCDEKSEFDGKCSPSLTYSPTTELKIAPQHNLPLGSKHADGTTVVQLDPQQVIVRMKPGDIVEIPFKYLHKPHDGFKDFFIQTSEFHSLGIGVEFSIICMGKRVQGRQCPDPKPGEPIEFFAKVSLNECRTGGDVAISIGAYGYHTVSALFITPLCGCDCEKLQNQEKRSPLCYGMGDLICGVCECDTGKGGDHCECDLGQYGVSTAAELTDKCRRNSNEPVCSGNGKCRCGRCECSAPHITGEFCDCEGLSCPMFEGKLCAGQGECSCGVCTCVDGFTGNDCSCTLDTSTCMEAGVLCSKHGSCECGKCICNTGFTGATCGISSQEEQEEDEEMKSPTHSEETPTTEMPEDETDMHKDGMPIVEAEGEELPAPEPEGPVQGEAKGTVEAIEEGQVAAASRFLSCSATVVAVLIARLL